MNGNHAAALTMALFLTGAAIGAIITKLAGRPRK